VTTVREKAPAAAEETGGGWWRGENSEARIRILALIGVLVAIWAAGAITQPATFLDLGALWNNQMVILSQSAAIGVIAVGMTFVMIGGGIDLSVGALVALSSVWCTTVATQEFGPVGVIFTALVVGLGAGMVNGLLVAYGRIVPFIVTLAMLASARGLAQLISGSKTQIIDTDNHPDLGIFTELGGAKVMGVRVMVIIMLVVAVIGWIVLNRTTFGRRTFAIGGNPEAARLAGINIQRHTLMLYALTGLCSGIAAILVVSLGNSGVSDAGELFELDAIAAAIIGGTALSGGRGSIAGAILGVVIFKGITNVFVANGLEQENQLIVKGAIIILAVLLQQVRVGSLRRATAS
jgi:ribose transport system permease protein